MNKILRRWLLYVFATFAVFGCEKTDRITIGADADLTLNGAVWEPEEMLRYLENPPNRNVLVSGDGFTFWGTAREFSDRSFKGIAAIVLEAVAQDDGPNDESDFQKENEIEQRDPFSLGPEPKAESGRNGD